MRASAKTTVPSEFGAPRRFERAWTAFLLVLVTAPYLFIRLRTPPGYRYDWIIPPYPADAYAYRAWARQAFDGLWLFSLKYTAAPNPRVIFLPFFLAAGKLARATGADVGLVFLVLKIAGTALFFRTLHGFLRRLKLSPSQSVAASLFVGLSAGIGAFAPLIFTEGLPLSWTPIDSWVVDSNTFWSLLWNPLYPFSLTLMLLALQYADESSAAGSARAAWLCGLCLAAEALIHPYPLAVLFPVVAALFAVRRRPGRAALWLRTLAASLPAAGYVALVALLNPAVRAHNALGSEDSFSWFAFVAGFGLPLALAAAGFALRPREFLARFWPLALWILLSATLAFSPVWLHIKFIFGAHLALCILAGAAAGPALELLASARAWRAAAAALFVAALPWTNVLHVRDAVRGALDNDDGSYLISADRRAALDYLAEHSRRSDVVFADFFSSAQVCAFAGNTVLWGHWAQAVDFSQRQAWMERVFSPNSELSPQERRRAFWDSGIEYAFLAGVWRTKLESAPNDAVLVGAEKIFENAAATIYRRPDDGNVVLNPASHSSNSAMPSASPTSAR